MRIAAILALLSGALIWPVPSQVGQAARMRPQGCAIILEAIDAANSLKPGVPRSEVEVKFELDGGISFPQRGTYVYRKCPYLKLDVDFAADDIMRRPTPSPTDTVVKMSRLYVAYPVAD
jgi:hypothetical protein